MDEAWWRGAIIYQIYPRSFLDTRADGVGDLAGIAERLDHVARLGADAVWISPFFRSPMKDFGYDVADYRDVDPLFGRLEDFDRVVARAHALGLKVLIDLVLSHTSDAHPWFEESRASRDGPKADWYVWADPKPDGTPPNNWLSIFGGPAWQWDVKRGQYYLHNFLTCQPDLNLHAPAVRQALLSEVEFWLERGVDGFRLDAINFSFHDPELTDNPPVPAAERNADLTPLCNPYSFQRHVHSINRPDVTGFLEELRALFDRYPGTTSVGEIGEADARHLAADYTQTGKRLHMAYTFALLGEDFSAARLRAELEGQDVVLGDGWMCWSFGNHDVPRLRTRWGGPDATDDFVRGVLALLFSLRASVCLYQGDELGLEEADVPFDRLQDPYGKTFWPEFRGRDGCRTPMPWRADAAHGGFSAAVEAWLPVPPAHLARAVDRQEADEASTLRWVRRFLAWRKTQPALRTGSIRFVDAGPEILAFFREAEGVRLAFAVNLSASPRAVPAAALGDPAPADAPGAHPDLDLPGHGFFVGVAS